MTWSPRLVQCRHRRLGVLDAVDVVDDRVGGRRTGVGVHPGAHVAGVGEIQRMVDLPLPRLVAQGRHPPRAGRRGTGGCGAGGLGRGRGGRIGVGGIGRGWIGDGSGGITLIRGIALSSPAVPAGVGRDAAQLQPGAGPVLHGQPSAGTGDLGGLATGEQQSGTHHPGGDAVGRAQQDHGADHDQRPFAAHPSGTPATRPRFRRRLCCPCPATTSIPLSQVPK